MQKKDPIIKQVAQERIERLFELAKGKLEKNGPESKKLSKRYVLILRNISSHYKIKIAPKIKNAICKSCLNVLVPGLNCKVRLSSSNRYVVYTCECGKEKHIFYK